ncbi:LuxR C-terminal-related transcriptional regulator [Pseudomonas nitroreducens]|uniref:LuxR C-terminal-related transcriptional regulator n=1 Tax=Pseudomonas nitroreducens TaxID=46680 RepID=UPI00147C44DC|nr:LuxR C-terminal-related transcriptional regulator [Pseudomonas nitroreducens]NNN24580.1 ATP-dependent transcriptional regulator [Pseudomonas nitroreducens]
MQGLGVSSNWAHTPIAIAPRLPTHHVVRPLLVAGLRDSRQRLILLCAPAGYGKSVLLAESFGAPLPGEELLWLNCRGQVPTLIDFCARIATAIGVPAQAAPTALLRQFGVPGRRLRLVLDDLPGELSIELNNWFEQLLVLPQSRVRLVLSCRQRPAWDLPSLLLRGELLELGRAQLEMSRGDLERVCLHFGENPRAGWLDDIWDQAGGWWGGACLLLAGGVQGKVLLRDYLEREVLARMTDDERRLFRGMCNLPRFSAELCAQLWEGGTGAQMLHGLLQQQAFLQPLDGEPAWYRVQPLVAGLLQDSVEPAELARLRLHACRLLSLAGHLHDAIDQALRAHQPEVAATYIERLKPSWQLADRHLKQVLEWRRQLPSQLMEGTPRLVYLSTLALLLSGRVGEAQCSLQGLSRFLPAGDDSGNRLLLAHWQALNGAIKAFRGELPEAERDCCEALAHFDESPRDWLSQLLCYFVLGRILLSTGRADEAQTLWCTALEQARRQGCQDSEALLQNERLYALTLDGRGELADLLLEDCLGRRAANGLAWDPVLGRLMLLRADLLMQQGKADASEAVLQAAQPHLRDCSAPFVLSGHLGLAEIAGRRGSQALAQAQLQRGERAMQCAQVDKGCYQPLLELQQLKLLAHAADWSAVLDAARRLALDHPVGGTLSVVLPPALPHEVQWFIAQAEFNLGRREQARARLLMLVEHCAIFGLRHLRSEVMDFLRRHDEHDAEEVAAGSSYQEGLTSREAAVLELLAKGLSNQGIADALFLSVNTVKYHAKNINAKLGANRRTEAIACAKARGLLA